MWGWVSRTTWSETQELGCTPSSPPSVTHELGCTNGESPTSPSSVAHELQTLLIETVPQCLLNSPTVAEIHPGEQK